MAFLESMNISASGLSASRLRMDTVGENIANINVTRSAENNGEPYRRRYVVYAERQPAVNTFAQFFHRAWQDRTIGRGVRVVEIGEDPSEFKLDYNPTHPDADAEGYVRLPNVELVQEMVDMMSAYRAYEANVTAFNTFKDMAVKTLELGK